MLLSIPIPVIFYKSLLLFPYFAGHLAEDPEIRELMSKQEHALHLRQLILMAGVNHDGIVVDQTCKTLSLLAQHSSPLARAILDADVGSLTGLLRSDDPTKQRACLGLISDISISLGENSNRLLSADVIDCIPHIINDPESGQDLRVTALKAMGDLAFSTAGKAQLGADARIMDTIFKLAEGDSQSGVETVPLRVKAAAVRALAILGDNLAVSRAVGRVLPKNRGLRILSLDGGGMKGMATVRLLREIEACTDRKIHELFDLIVGTSTGGLLAVALGLKRFSLDECEHMYKVLGQRVFSRTGADNQRRETLRETAYRVYHSTTHNVRFAAVGSERHDSSVYETLLKEYCSFKDDIRCVSDSLIDTACLNVPKVALLATKTSTDPPMPFVFRNYELPLATAAEREKICFQEGSSKYAVWQAVRASSAALYYFTEFSCLGETFQDGAFVANNPAVVALQEARALWPEAPLDVHISIGSGSTPQSRRDRGAFFLMDAGSMILNSVTSVERTHEAMATMTPLVPNFKYFRFNPLDPRCSMDLDETDPERWVLFEEATDDFINENENEFDAAAVALLGGLALPKRASKAKLAATAAAAAKKMRNRLPLHCGLWVCTSIPPGSEPTSIETAAAVCARLDACSGDLDLQSLLSTGKNTHPRTRNQGSGSDLGPSSAPVTASAQPLAEASSSSSSQVMVAQDPEGSAAVGSKVTSAVGSIFGWFSSSAKPSGATRSVPTTPPGPVGEINEECFEDGTNIPPPAEDALPVPPSHPLDSAPESETAGSSISQTALPETSNGNYVDLLFVLQESIQKASPPVGIVLLVLRSSVKGLVLRWTDTFHDVTEPSKWFEISILPLRGAGYLIHVIKMSLFFLDLSGNEAEAIIRGAGYDPGTTSLVDLLEQGGGEIIVQGVLMRAVSKEYRRLAAGQLAISLRCTIPETLLDSIGINKVRSSLEGKIVLCSEPLLDTFLKAFIEAGVFGVVAPEKSLSNCARADSAALGAFWSGIISGLQGGSDVASALKRAEESNPALSGVFKLHQQ